jgi:hypothetical protein
LNPNIPDNLWFGAIKVLDIFFLAASKMISKFYYFDQRNYFFDQQFAYFFDQRKLFFLISKIIFLISTIVKTSSKFY